MTSGTIQTRREQLRDFLRGRRARLRPAEVGIPTSGRRRTPGLRREEVAVLAGVGVSWYTWLEQGRDITVSGDVLDAIAGAMLLSEVERAHLYVLAGMNPPPASGVSVAEVTPEVRQILDSWIGPAVLRDRYWNVLAYNDAAQAVLGFDGTARNCLVTFFTSPRYRAMRREWAAAAPNVVAAYRADVAHAPEDPGYRRVVRELTAESPEFAELWERHEVGASVQAVNGLRHPDLGELFFIATSLVLADQPTWHVVLYAPQAGTDTVARLGRLNQPWLAEPA